MTHVPRYVKEGHAVTWLAVGAFVVSGSILTSAGIGAALFGACALSRKMGVLA